MAHWAKPGVKVVCVDVRIETAGLPPVGYRWRNNLPLEEGRIYTIRSVGSYPFDGEIVVKLAEVADRSETDYGYSLARFRPLVTRTEQQDVALFRHLLKPAGVDA